MDIYLHHVHICCRGSLKTVVKESCASDGYWELNWGPLVEKPGLPTSKPQFNTQNRTHLLTQFSLDRHVGLLLVPLSQIIFLPDE